MPIRTAILAAAFAVFGAVATARAERLPTTVTPEHYDLAFTVDLSHARFDGIERIEVHVAEATNRIVLHALDLTVRSASVAAGGAVMKATVAMNTDQQTATLTLPQPVQVGTAEISLSFAGILNDKLRGFYLSKGKHRNYAVTQFEATDARRAFPCFDEPSFKATFQLTLTIDKGDTAISNGTVISDTPGPSATQHTLKFSTSPKMSSYLVAMGVGDFQCLSGAQGSTPIRICATPDKKALGQIALESAQQILKYYDSYFDIRYPFGKLDVLAVPDFAAGAMENTAAIFYRESDLLADSQQSSVDTRKNIASILAHEMAHQWFGNLVTMAWWDDIWLNEGFATWMANLPLAAWRPEWNIDVDAVIENEAALNLDSLASTRPVHTHLETPAEIDEAFDAIAYQKGAALLRMIEHYVGAATFQKGINAYLQAHAYGNATSQDFWTAIAAASGKPVDKILPTFVNQPGAPLVGVSLACANGKTDAHLTQQRFLLSRSEAVADETWQIPVCVKTTSDTTMCRVVGSPSETATLDAGGCATWVFANTGALGYYRTEYAPEVLKAMAPHVEDSLTAPERRSLVGNEWALVRAGRHTAGDYLTLASGFGSEHSSGVLSAVTDRLAFIKEYLTEGRTAQQLEAMTQSLLQPLLKEIGFTSLPSDDDERRRLRSVVILALGTTGADPDVIARSRAALDASLAGGPPLDPTLASSIVQVASEGGDARLFDALVAASTRASTPENRYRYRHATTQFHEAALIDRALNFALSPELRSQDTSIYLSQVIGNEQARQRAWDFIKAHWTELEPRITIFGNDTTLVGALASFCDGKARDDIKTFFSAHPLPSAVRALDQTLERIDNCIALRGTQTGVVVSWLEAR